MTKDDAQERSRTEQLARLGGLLARFAHEIRNPLSTIGLNLQLVQEDLAPSEEPRDQRACRRLAVVSGEVRRLQDILEGFLRFVRNPPLERRPTDLNALLQSVVEFTAPEMQKRGVMLRFFAGADVGQPLVDPAQLRAAVVNLLRNACDACREGDEVMVSAKRDGDHVVVRVTDTGAGMTADVRESAFTPYFSTKSGGTGLGLPTVRRTVEEHGGTVELSSEPGRGTQFTLRLPVHAHTQDAADTVDVADAAPPAPPAPPAPAATPATPAPRPGGAAARRAQEGAP